MKTYSTSPDNNRKIKNRFVFFYFRDKSVERTVSMEKVSRGYSGICVLTHKVCEQKKKKKKRVRQLMACADVNELFAIICF